jgi:hypothetical protein
MRFSLDSDMPLFASIFDLNGRLVAKILERPGKKGLNELLFSTEPLSDGIYTILIVSNNKVVRTENLVVCKQK